MPLTELYIECPRCDLNVANCDGKTPLLLAIENKNIEVLRALLDKDYGERRVKVEADVS